MVFHVEILQLLNSFSSNHSLHRVSACKYNGASYEDGDEFNPNGDPCDICKCMVKYLFLYFYSLVNHW